MKTIVKYIGGLCLMLISLHACKTDDMQYVDAQVAPVRTLYEPANEKAVKLLNSASASLYFEWEAVSVEDGGAALYEVVFDKAGGDFSKPIYRVVSDNNGFAHAATITHKVLNKVVALVDLEPGATGDIIWSVVASRGLNSQLAQETRTLTITSLSGFADVPDEVFITGEASEGGTELAEALPFKLVAPGEFEIYTKLEGGKTYYFTDRTSGTPRVFFSPDGVALKESSNNESITATTTGVYRISLDFNVSTISFMEVKNMGLWFSPSNQILWNLDYQGKGIWTGTGMINFKVESWGKDQRYKFQMETIANGSDATMQLGTLNGTDSAPTDSSDPSYYYVRILPNVSQWDDKWKFMDKFDGKMTTISVIMQGNTPYTHSVSLN